MICRANQLTDFYMMATLLFNELNKIKILLYRIRVAMETSSLMFFVDIHNGVDFLLTAFFAIQGNLDIDEMTFSSLEENAANMSMFLC